MYEKMKSLKVRLRGWKREIFWWIYLKVEEKISEINDLDLFWKVMWEEQLRR